MPMVSLKLMAGAARSMVLVASARTTAAKITVRACGGVQGRSGGRTASWGPGGGSYRFWGDFRNDAQRGDLKKRHAPKGISVFLSSMHAK